MKPLTTIILFLTALLTSSFSDMANPNRYSLQISSSTLRDIADVLILDFVFILHITGEIFPQHDPMYSSTSHQFASKISNDF
jgi:hypothetical protein